jgi:sterol desaturase/sphingolipid hydroxylase (fatty acid hydroxylase superfamily)
MIVFAFFCLAVFLGSLIEYVAHRLMHAGYLFPAQHRCHHTHRGARGWFWEFGEYFLWLSPVMALGFLYSVAAGIGLFLGGLIYTMFVAYSHQLQHEHPERAFWLKYPIHYLHHRYDKGNYNYGVLVDVWDRALGTYRTYPYWRPPAEYRFSVRGLFDIKWF